MIKIEVWLVSGQRIQLECADWALDDGGVVCDDAEGMTRLAVAAGQWTHVTVERISDEN